MYHEVLTKLNPAKSGQGELNIAKFFTTEAQRIFCIN